MFQDSSSLRFPPSYPRRPGRAVSQGPVIDKVLSKQVQIVDSSGQTYIIQGGNQDIMDAIQGNYRIVLVFGGRTNGSSINRLIQRLLRPPNPG